MKRLHPGWWVLASVDVFVLMPLRRAVCVARGHDQVGPFWLDGEPMLLCRRCTAAWSALP